MSFMYKGDCPKSDQQRFCRKQTPHLTRRSSDLARNGKCQGMANAKEWQRCQITFSQQALPPLPPFNSPCFVALSASCRFVRVATM
eukprot:1138717-Pelagomonas_calceolata.AAC.1